MKKISLILLCIATFYNCNSRPKTVTENGGLIIDVVLSKGFAENEISDSIVSKLQKRLEAVYPKNNPSVRFDANSQSFIAEIPEIDKADFNPLLISAQGNFEISEGVRHPVFWNNLTNDSILSDNDTLHLVRPYDINNLGIAHIDDTAKINSFLNSKKIKEALNLNFSYKLAWGKPLVENDPQLESFVPLYCIKKSKKNIDLNEGYKSSKIELDRYNYIWIKLKKEYAQKFESLTRENIGRILCISLDNIVISAPSVHSVISEGNMTISGRFEYQDLLVFESLLKSGVIQSNLKIKSVNQIRTK